MTVFEKDHYAILGVLPDAQDVVITAAYRALARQYHPDLSHGNPADSHKRMVEISSAYEVIGNATHRAKYDSDRSKVESAEFFSDDDDVSSEAFSSALSEIEWRWDVACGIYPDLAEYRIRLGQISTSLSFAFVTTLLERKIFQDRHRLAEHLELMFLRRYFGTDDEILNFARSLIFSGLKLPAKKLNQLVDVLGSDVDAEAIIERVSVEFNLRQYLKNEIDESENLLKIRKLSSRVRRSILDFRSAKELAELNGFTVEEVSRYFIVFGSIVVKSKSKETLKFSGRLSFCNWVLDTFS